MSGKADLEVTALYTAGTWAWAELPCAALFASDETARVFGVTNLFLALARPFQSRPASLRHGLVQRHVLIDQLVRASGARAVLELAAGLSRRGACFSAEPSLAYVELDQPHVIERKRALLERTEEGRSVAARQNFTLAAADVVQDALAPHAPGDGPLVVIAEGLLVYLPAEAQRALFSRVAALLQGRGGRLLFDYVPGPEEPPPGLVGRALGWLLRRFTKGGGFVRDARTRDELLAELRAAGFTQARWLEPKDAPADWGVPHLQRFTRQLVFEAVR